MQKSGEHLCTKLLTPDHGSSLYEVFTVPPRWQFLKIETKDGLVGWGEPIVEGRAETVKMAVSELMDTYVVGEDPLRIEDLWQRMYRSGFYRGGPVLMSAIAGIDQALWDIKGKYYDAPIFDLLGGQARDRIRIYIGLDTDGREPADIAEDAEAQVEDGFTAVKMKPTGKLDRIDTPSSLDAAREQLRAVREAVGPEIDIGLDFHGRVSKSMAKRLAAELEPYDPMFYEEPVLSEHNDALGEIAAATTIPLATGERMYSRWDFKSVLEQGAVDIVQPDVSHAGGITETKKIADMAEAYDVALAPHSPLGPIALAACLQVDACSPNALIQEQVLHRSNYRASADLMFGYLNNPELFDYQDGGFISIPDGDGLGVDIDESFVREMQTENHYRFEGWRYEDGRIAEY